MRMKIGDPNFEWVLLKLDGEVVGMVVAFDTDEGWIDQKLTNWYRATLGMPAVDPIEEAESVVRRTGKVEFCGYVDH